MAFQSVRKFASVRKSVRKSGVMLSLNITERGYSKNGDRQYSVSLLLSPELVTKMQWDASTRVDVLVDNENQLGLLRKDLLGYALSFPKNSQGERKGVSACIKFSLHESFDYLPKDSGRIELTLIESGNDQIVFEMPKMPNPSETLLTDTESYLADHAIKNHYSCSEQPFRLHF